MPGDPLWDDTRGVAAAEACAVSSVQIRDARDEDADQVIALIASCYREYPGCVLDVDGEEPELRAMASAYRDRGGRFWVAVEDGRVVGCVGVLPAADKAAVMLKKLYVAREARRRGLGERLCQLAESQARALGAPCIELWSDTRFTEAHRFYERRGYARGKHTRALHDRSNSLEFHFHKNLERAPG